MNTNTFTKDNLYLMLALDHRGSFEKIAGTSDIEKLIQIKKEIIFAVKNNISGLLIDEEYGLPAYRNLDITSPYLLPAEKTGYKEENGERITEIEKNALEIKNLGADGVKLLIYFNPFDHHAYQQIETAKKVLDDAKISNLPLFLEIVTYNIQDENSVVRSVEMFIENEVDADVFKLEYPENLENAKEITKILGETPWILLTRGANFEEFCEQLKISAEGGCKGFLAGRSLWQEFPKIMDQKEKDEFLNKTLPGRFERICQIVQQFI